MSRYYNMEMDGEPATKGRFRARANRAVGSVDCVAELYAHTKKQYDFYGAYLLVVRGQNEVGYGIGESLIIFIT